MSYLSRYLTLWFIVPIFCILLAACTTKTDRLSASNITLFPGKDALSPQGDIERYYPQKQFVTRWYLVKDLQTGKTVDFISFTIVGQISFDGHTLYLIENNHTQGVSIDYQEITAEQVLLHRLLLVNQGDFSDTIRDVSFTPPLPLLRAPLEVGRSWSENTLGDKPYVYRVESRKTVSALGKNLQDCLQVVRTRGGAPDYKNEYCPQVGIAAFETLTPEGKWVRAELAAITSELTLAGVRNTTQSCEYIFDPLGFSPGEPLTVTITPPALNPLTFQRPSTENIHIGVNKKAPFGRWLVQVQRDQQKAFSVFEWTGVCRAGLLAPPPSIEPSLILIGQEADALGQNNYLVAGSGWKAGESLSFTQSGPGWQRKTIPLGQANEEGVSMIKKVTFAPNSLPGKYILTLQGETQTATLTIKCREDGLCFGPFPRVMTSVAR